MGVMMMRGRALASVVGLVLTLSCGHQKQPTRTTVGNCSIGAPSLDAIEIIDSLRRTRVRGSQEFLGPGEWILKGVYTTGPNSTPDVFFATFFRGLKYDYPRWHRVWLITNGDCSDLYMRITGKTHPRLSGQVSEVYKETLRQRKDADGE